MAQPGNTSTQFLVMIILAVDRLVRSQKFFTLIRNLPVTLHRCSKVIVGELL